MRILQTCRSLGAGGIEAIVCALSNELAKTESVTVCTLKKPYHGDLFYNKLSPSINKCSINRSDNNNPLFTVFHVWKYLQKEHFDVFRCFTLTLCSSQQPSEAGAVNTVRMHWGSKLLDIKHLFFISDI